MTNENDSINDLVVSGLDAVMPLDKSQKQLLERVDTIIEDSVAQKNPNIAGDALKYLLGISRISGLALAKTIYLFKYQWENFNRRETFEDYLVDYAGITEITVKRYYRVWDMFVSGDVPKDYLPKLKLLPIKSLVPISNLWFQKYEISSHNWMALSNASNPSEVGAICRKIKGKEVKKGTLSIEWSQSDKQITFWKDGKPHPVYLTYDEMDEVVIAGLDRVLGAGKSLEK